MIAVGLIYFLSIPTEILTWRINAVHTVQEDKSKNDFILYRHTYSELKDMCFYVFSTIIDLPLILYKSQYSLNGFE